MTNWKILSSKIYILLQGRALDVAVDLRKNSKTYGKVFQKILVQKFNRSFNSKRFWHGVVILKIIQF